METLKFLCIALLSLLLLKNLGIVAWNNGAPQARLQETRGNLMDTLQGEPLEEPTEGPEGIAP